MHFERSERPFGGQDEQQQGALRKQRPLDLELNSVMSCREHR